MENQRLESILYSQMQKLQNLETATELIKNKSVIYEDLNDAYVDLCSVTDGIQGLKEDVKLMKDENERCRKLSIILSTLDHQIQCMEKNVPPKLEDYVNSKTSKTPDKLPNNKVKNVNGTLNNTTEYTNNINDSHIATDIKNCKKVLFNEPDIIPQLQSITEEEFAKIPKYIISRHTLEMLNSLISNINQIIKNKYSLLALGRSGKKKADLDLYLNYKKQQASLGVDEEHTYFFTPEDFERIIKAKIDKTKLNLLIALRHCKRLREIRTAKNVHYALILSTN